MLVKAKNELSSSLSSDQLGQLQQVIHQYSPLQLAWASGYLAAKSENPSQSAPVVASVSSSAAGTLTVLYGSQTGNAKSVAEQVFKEAQGKGIQAKLVNMADFKPKSLKTETHILIVASTNGEGEAPDDAIALHEFLASKRAPKLDTLNYSVLALGDSSYEFFCQTGKDFDERLAALGAKRISDRIDCDVEYQDEAKAWQDKNLDVVAKTLQTGTADVVQLPFDGSLNGALDTAESTYTKENPFEAVIIANQKITGRDSNKVVQHIEIDLSGSDLTYKPGDALGIWPENDPRLVSTLLSSLGLDSTEQVTHNDETLSLEKALVEKLEVTGLSKAVIVKWAAIEEQAKLDVLLTNGALVREYINSKQVIDLISEYPVKVTAQQLVDILANIIPRLYSIASSQEEVEDEVHLTIGLVAYQEGDDDRLGCASGYLIERLKEDDTVKVFIEDNHNFVLPENTDTPIIMVGPGTGVAPFRSFLQHRDATEAEGKNWLFFGDQTFTQDFLYQVEWQAYVKSGLLTHIDLAFSRDQAEKVYVQHKLEQAGAEVFQWLEDGAHFYICGDMQHMAKDVHSALVNIIVTHGKKSSQEAEDYLKELRINKRYQKDVY